MLQLLPVTLAYALLAGGSAAQQYPLPITFDTILKSPVDPSVTISYKQPNPGTCATAFDTQKQYTGYVNLPPFTLTTYSNYSSNIFFWFFESRTSPETASLTIWLNGGPGTSSMIGLFQELGPCEVVQLPNGTEGIQPRLWGWDRSSNLLFIDQPTQTGFSYDERVNASVDFKQDYPFKLENRMQPQALPNSTPSWRFMNATLTSGREYNTQGSAVTAATACWHFLQGFFSTFPQYNPGSRPNSTSIGPAGVNLFAESYGGIYGPTFADFFQDQNDRRKNGSIPASTLKIQLGSVGIISGIVDQLVQAISVANFSRNNNFGIEAIDLVTFQNAISDIESTTGCRSLVAQCRDRLEGSGQDKYNNLICEAALHACTKVTGYIYETAGKSMYDIRVRPEIGPGAAYQEYLNSADMLQSIGAQIKFTWSSVAVSEAFEKTGDSVRGTQLSSLADLLNRGVRVAFIYGDADIICNWYGGENASLELARLVPSYSNAFPAAGYADIVVNDSYVGGQVRQYGNLSFSRIYDAGHMVPYYQPETAFTVFTRIIQGNDIGLGRNINLSTFGTKGPQNSTHPNRTPSEPASTCWLRDTLNTCVKEQRDAINQGQGFVKDGIWVPGDDNNAPRSSLQIRPTVASLKPTTTSSMPLTGVFTATTTPISSSEASSRSHRFRLPRRFVAPHTPVMNKRDARKSRRIRYGLLIGLACGGDLLLVLLIFLLYYFCRRYRRKDNNRTLHDDTEKATTNAVVRVGEEEPLPSHRPTTLMNPIPEASARSSEDT